jgi:hypothetical protein
LLSRKSSHYFFSVVAVIVKGVAVTIIDEAIVNKVKKSSDHQNEE